jgi:hypothetical protein
MVATPYRTLIAREFPQRESRDSVPVQFSLAPVPSKSWKFDSSWQDNDSVEVNVPLQVSKIAEGSFVRIYGEMLTVEASQGLRWSSGWKAGSELLSPDQSKASIDFEVKKQFFDKVKSGPVKVRVSLALIALRRDDPKQVTAERGNFSIPAGGMCSISLVRWTSLECRFPVRSPSFMVETNSSATTCPPSAEEPPVAGKTQRAWEAEGDDGPISPVITKELYLRAASEDRWTSAQVCPGTPLVFSTLTPVQKFRVEIEAQGSLADYSADPIILKTGSGKR